MREEEGERCFGFVCGEDHGDEGREGGASRQRKGRRVGRTSGRTYYRHTDDGDGAAAGQPFPAAFAQ